MKPTNNTGAVGPDPHEHANKEVADYLDGRRVHDVVRRLATALHYALIEGNADAANDALTYADSDLIERVAEANIEDDRMHERMMGGDASDDEDDDPFCVCGAAKSDHFEGSPYTDGHDFTPDEGEYA